MTTMATIWKSVWNFFSWTERPITRNLIGTICVTCRSKITEIVPIGNPTWPPPRHFGNVFGTSTPKWKDKLTQNLVGSINVTCRSNIAKQVPIGNPRRLQSWKSILFLFFCSEPKGQLTRNFVGSIGVTCILNTENITKIISIRNPR